MNRIDLSMMIPLITMIVASKSLPHAFAKGQNSNLFAYVQKNSDGDSYNLRASIEQSGSKPKAITLSHGQGSFEHVLVVPRKGNYLVVADPSRVPDMWLVSPTGKITHLDHKFGTDDSFAHKGGTVIFSERRTYPDQGRKVKSYFLLNVQTLKSATVSRSEAKRKGLSFLDWNKTSIH
jgi:hypothetical protein